MRQLARGLIASLLSCARLSVATLWPGSNSRFQGNLDLGTTSEMGQNGTVERVHPRILLIENLERMGRMIALYLLSSGYELATTSDPEAIEPRLITDPPDLIIFNTGLEAAQKSAYINRWREAV